MCALDSSQPSQFVFRKDAPVDDRPWGPHFWACKPGLVDTSQLLVVQVDMPPGTGHAFHRHPGREEVLWIIEGEAEQWIGEQSKLLGPGDSAFISPDTVHATFNSSQKLLRFLAILSPAELDGPISVDVQHDEPWRSLRAQPK